MAKMPYPSYPVILVDDEPQALTSYETALQYQGINHVISCRQGGEVFPLLARQGGEVILLDLLMPKVSGEEVLQQISRDHPYVPVIVVTGVNDVDTAVRCMKMGAFDYLVKPIDNERLVTTVTRAIAFQELQRENRNLKQSLFSQKLARPGAFSDILTRDETMRSVFLYSEAVAQTQKPVLITGETGVGKELLASAIHRVSNRKGPFLAANVAGLDDNMFSDTLFGHIRGAFTGADTSRKGLLEAARGGTLLLDEIGDISAASQMKLLRLLQEGEYLTMGEDRPRHADVRIIATTNQNIHALQREGGYRKDLYYRLSTHHVAMPPLRKRRKDIPLLLDHFLEKASESLGKRKPTPPPELLDLLASYHFPGNIRELENLVFDAVSQHHGRMLSMESFFSHIAPQPSGLDSHRDSYRENADEHNPEGDAVRFSERLPTIRQTTRLLIKEALERSNGNITIAARLLGISHQALRKRLKRDPIE
ncbi:MAG: sigma-54 dependent transcriptional regulator [Desulfosalsimonadaceae bacterium]